MGQRAGRLAKPSSDALVQKLPTDRFLNQLQFPVNCPPDPGGLVVTDGHSQIGLLMRLSGHHRRRCPAPRPPCTLGSVPNRLPRPPPPGGRAARLPAVTGTGKLATLVCGSGSANAFTGPIAGIGGSGPSRVFTPSCIVHRTHTPSVRLPPGRRIPDHLRKAEISMISGSHSGDTLDFQPANPCRDHGSFAAFGRSESGRFRYSLKQMLSSRFWSSDLKAAI